MNTSVDKKNYRKQEKETYENHQKKRNGDGV